MNRRTFLKTASGACLTLMGISGGTYFYSKEIETASLHIQKETVRSKKIPPSFHNKKIIQFSDTHIGFNYTIKDLKKLVETINKQKPDLIVFTGDLIDNPLKSNEKTNNQIADALKTLDAPHGKFWVYGNHDHGGYGTEQVLEIMEAANFNLLKNSHISLHPQLVLAGVDDVMLGKPDLRATLQGADSDALTILLAHAPDYADKAVTYPVDVQLSGHSHGGQIRFPFLGHLYTPLHAHKYVLGKYNLQNKLELYVNAGIGTTRVPYRFLCNPEIHEYTLKTDLS